MEIVNTQKNKRRLQIYFTIINRSSMMQRISQPVTEDYIWLMYKYNYCGVVLGIGQENHNRLSEELNRLIIDCTIGFC